MKRAKYTKPLTVAFKESEFADIKNESDRLQESMAEVVRMIVSRYFRERMTLKKEVR